MSILLQVTLLHLQHTITHFKSLSRIIVKSAINPSVFRSVPVTFCPQYVSNSCLSYSIPSLNYSLYLSINWAMKLSPDRSFTPLPNHTLHHVTQSTVHSLLSINHPLTSSEQMGVVTVYINCKSRTVFLSLWPLYTLNIWRFGGREYEN